MPRPTFRAKIAADITDKINRGEYQPGQRLPSQRQLAETYGCSVEPVIRALEDLERAGLVEPHQGVAWFVAGGLPS